MRTKKVLPPHARETLVFKDSKLPNGKLVLRLSSVYHDYIVVELSVRFCKGQDFNDLPDDLVDEALYQSFINPVLLPDDSSL